MQGGGVHVLEPFKTYPYNTSVERLPAVIVSVAMPLPLVTSAEIKQLYCTMLEVKFRGKEKSSQTQCVIIGSLIVQVLSLIHI